MWVSALFYTYSDTLVIHLAE